MEIILTKDVVNLGMAGQVLKVAPGYARNFLLPSGRAMEATAGNLKAMAKKRAEFETRAKESKDLATDMKTKLAALCLVLPRKSGEKGKLYGAVTPQDIVSAAQDEGFELDRKKLRLAEPIKTLGDFEVTIKLHAEVTGTFKVKVISDAPPTPAQDEAAEALETPGKKTRAPKGAKADAAEPAQTDGLSAEESTSAEGNSPETAEEATSEGGPAA
ncbi:MAG: 50S ribosomal protein L9 [Deltaproteobacteria bacterium]|jgi:large subunit ribosomal protein L9|nr:50S ribosomal protein L9 [Deltaproteobacteria bacterium]